MPSVSCPGCDESMEIEREWYGRKVECPDCGERFVAKRPGADDEGDEDRRPKKRRAWEEDEDAGADDRPRRKKTRRPERPKPFGRGAHQLLIACVVGGGLLLSCAGCVGWVAFQIFGPMNYSASWVPQANQDGSYGVQFPRSPRRESDTNQVVGGHGPSYMLLEDPPADAVFLFSSLDDSHLSFDAAYKAEVDSIMQEVKSEGAKLSGERAVTACGLSGKEAVIAAGPSKVVFRMLDASKGGKRRYLLLMAGGRNVSEGDRNKFLDSLKAGG